MYVTKSYISPPLLSALDAKILEISWIKNKFNNTAHMRTQTISFDTFNIYQYVCGFYIEYIECWIFLLISIYVEGNYSSVVFFWSDVLQLENTTSTSACLKLDSESLVKFGSCYKCFYIRLFSYFKDINITSKYDTLSPKLPISTLHTALLNILFIYYV